MPKALMPKDDSIENVDRFILDWHRFPLDYWWRKKHNVPFGSQQHRDMNFIDMLVEYREEIVIDRLVKEYESEKEQQENINLGLKDNQEVIRLSKEQIDDDYDNLDLSQFDKL